MEMDDVEDHCSDDDDSVTTIFSTSSQGSAKTIMSLLNEELHKAFAGDGMLEEKKVLEKMNCQWNCLIK